MIQTNAADGTFDGVPISEELDTHEQNEWRRWRQRIDETRQKIIVETVYELLIRGCARPRTGRPSALVSYKNYKRIFLQDWAQFITRSAKQAGLNQHELAAAFGFSEASEWRALKRGANNCYRMTYERFVRHTRETVQPRGWYLLRKGNLVHLWSGHLMNAVQFEEWAKNQKLPQNCSIEEAHTC